MSVPHATALPSPPHLSPITNVPTFVQNLLALLPLPSTLASSQHAFAFSLAVFASMGTFVGGIAVIVLVKFAKADTRSSSTARLMGVLQAFSAGVMLYMTFADLLPESKEQLGSRETTAWFFCGIASFGVLERWLFPEHEEEEEILLEEPHGHNRQKNAGKPPAMEAISTSVSSQRDKSSGSLAEDCLRQRVKTSNRRENESDDRSPDLNSAKGRRDLWRTSVITFAAMTLHNLPEGLGVYLSTLADVKLGLQLAVAIMLHNIPEGMAVAIPLYVATDGSSARVLWMTLANGLAEPAGVIIGGCLLNNFLSPAVLSRCLAGVAGIMACISLHELQPTAVRYSGKDLASFSLFVGMFVCWIAMEGVSVLMGRHDHQ